MSRLLETYIELFYYQEVSNKPPVVAKEFITRLLDTISDIDEDAIVIEYNLDPLPSKKGIKIPESQALSVLPKFVTHLKAFFPRFKSQKSAGRVYFSIHLLHQTPFSDIQMILKDKMHEDQLYISPKHVQH